MSIMNKVSGLRDILPFDNWPMICASRLLDRKTGLVVYRKNGVDIVVDHRGGDENGTRVCIATNMYSKYLPKFDLRGPIRVLDLGANGGGFPLMLKISGIEMSRTVSVEMNPMTYLRLHLNLITNLGSCAVAINAAATGRSEESETLIKASRGSTGEGIYDDGAQTAAGSVRVRTTTLQALYDQYFKDELIDICKIDIEGAEYEVLDAASDDLLRKIRYLVIEFHDPAKTPALVERLSALGFLEVKPSADTMRKRHPDEVFVFQGPQAGK